LRSAIANAEFFAALIVLSLPMSTVTVPSLPVVTMSPFFSDMPLNALTLFCELTRLTVTSPLRALTFALLSAANAAGNSDTTSTKHTAKMMIF